MDLLGLVTVPNWLLILIILLYIIHRYCNRHSDHFKQRGIKEREGSAGLTSVFKRLHRAKQLGLGHMDLEDMKKHGKFHGSIQLMSPVLMVADPDLLRQIMVKDCLNHFPDRRQDLTNMMSDDIKDGVSAKTGDDWKHMRNMLTPIFSAGKLKKMMDLINEVSARTVVNIGEHADKKTEIESKTFFGSYTMDAVASTLFGIEIDSQNDKEHTFVDSAQKMFSFNMASPVFVVLFLATYLMPFLLAIPGIKSRVARSDSTRVFKEIISQAVQQRKDGSLNRPDMIQLMLNVHKEGEAEEDVKDGMEVLGAEQITEGGGTPRRGMTSSEILANALIFFLAGFETTATALTFMSWVLSRYPDIQTKLIQEVDDVVGDDEQITYEQINKMTFLDQVFCETLRMWPPAVRTDRLCTRDVVLENGVQLRRGDVIGIPIYAIHHLDEFWGDDHMTFKPERFTADRKKERNPYTYLPFGVGPRGCVGMRLAILEAKTVVVKILQNFKFIRGVNMLSDSDVNDFRPVPFTRPKKDIHVMVERRDKN